MPLPCSKEKKQDYVARFMADPAMRRKYPDQGQRYKVALAHWLKRGKLSRRALKFELLKRLGECQCVKQDIPEVEAIIAFMAPLLENVWADSLRSAVDEVIRLLESFDDRTPDPEVDFLQGLYWKEDRTFFFQTVEDRVYEILLGAARRLPADAEAVTEDSADELLYLAALAAGGAYGVLQGSVDPILKTAAVEDLRTLLGGRIVIRESDFKSLAHQWLVDPRIRQPLTAAPGAPLGAPSQGRLTTRAQWEKALRQAVGLQGTGWLRTVTDLWAYRWYTIGAWRSLRRANVDIIVAKAIIDERTTTFCRWVDGRPLNINKIDHQIENHIKAVMKGDVQDMMDNWPMITNQEILTGSPDSVLFAKTFSNLGLPPYHFRCRTRPVAKRPA